VWRIVGLLIVACSGPATRAPDHGGLAPTVTTKRVITPRAKLPAELLGRLPQHGIYVEGSGTKSRAWRIVIDADTDQIVVGTAREPNAPIDKLKIRELSQRNEVLLMRLAEDAWREVPPSRPPDPTPGYDEIMIVVDGDDAFFLQGHGPIVEPLAAKAIVELRAAAGL
jgi:hypothetical protein